MEGSVMLNDYYICPGLKTSPLKTSRTLLVHPWISPWLILHLINFIDNQQSSLYGELMYLAGWKVCFNVHLFKYGRKWFILDVVIER